MNATALQAMGIPRGESAKEAYRVILVARGKGREIEDIRKDLAAVANNPDIFLEDPLYGSLARVLLSVVRPPVFISRISPAPFRIWGEEIESDALDQMRNAAMLPVSVRGALMPDAHSGYGLPIGGVLATENAVIPYAVGMDIACRMKMSVFDLPVTDLERGREWLREVLDVNTCFGVGASTGRKASHPVFDEDWSVTSVTRRIKDKAWMSAESSGSGNHFASFCLLEVEKDHSVVPAGKHFVLLTHSGSRGAGSDVAAHYSKIATEVHRNLPKELSHLAWLSMESEPGQEYWAAMELMGRYAAAIHEMIHNRIREALGAKLVAGVENHHNFAWREKHVCPDGEIRELIVHRKGATPAGVGILGVIPGTMATPGYVVRGLGNPESLNSAAHGAGRRMSRTAARNRYSQADMEAFLKKNGVDLLSAGVDECPMAYKNIESVMDAQADLVEKIGRFIPKIVKMAPGSERGSD